jgi:hypothetical protein
LKITKFRTTFVFESLFKNGILVLKMGRGFAPQWMDGQDSLAKLDRRQPPALFPLRKLFWIANWSFFVPICGCLDDFFFEFGYCNTFVYIWQLVFNHGLI